MIPEPDMNNTASPLDAVIALQRANLLPDIEQAVGRGDAMLAFQPVVQSERTRHTAFYEGLFRVIDATGRFVPLGDFMPQAESSELGRQIDCLSLAMGLRALQDDPGLRLSINMSARSIGHPVWTETLRRGIAHDERIAERLILEVTESSAMAAPEKVSPFMQDLQRRGVSFALDDFGAGYTSFRYLREFNFDMVKIDGQFVREISRQSDHQVLTQALQAIAHHFDMLTVAEQVETADEAAYLISIGIDCLQGFYFGAPTISPPGSSPKTVAMRAAPGW
ncbi:MAG: EAL domain-containing protein [Paracoccus sp. (in: a-proteobacteria)]|nr:EAL domain-containing protein [Paracoccus sp. (in: a-proteobacteria)]